jgi:hypothetical protein
MDFLITLSRVIETQKSNPDCVMHPNDDGDGILDMMLRWVSIFSVSIFNKHLIYNCKHSQTHQTNALLPAMGLEMGNNGTTT